MQPSVAFGGVEINNSINVFVNSYPSMIFFSAYFVVLFLWYHLLVLLLLNFPFMVLSSLLQD